MKQNKQIFKKCMLGTGFTLLALLLPLLKFYTFAPEQFLQTFEFLVH